MFLKIRKVETFEPNKKKANRNLVPLIFYLKELLFLNILKVGFTGVNPELFFSATQVGYIIEFIIFAMLYILKLLQNL